MGFWNLNTLRPMILLFGRKRPANADGGGCVKLRLSQLLCIVILAGAFLVISDGYAETKAGLASYYGAELAGQPTASGEPFNPYGFTAAQKTLPLGTELVVSYGGGAAR